MNEIFARDLNGEIVSPSDQGYDELINSIWDTMKTAAELNNGYHTPDEVRRILGEIIGQEVDESVTLLPPFYGIFPAKLKRSKKPAFWMPRFSVVFRQWWRISPRN